MTRDECLIAVSNAFGGVFAEATVGYWNVRVSTTPPREVVLMSGFVEANIGVKGITPGELTERIKAAPDSSWGTDRDGLLFLAVHQ